MRFSLVVFLFLALFVSCGSSVKKADRNSGVPSEFITVVENVDNYSVAYTENGHTMIYKNDSAGNVIVYYAKFENNAGKYGVSGIDEKIIRVELDSSLNIVKSILSFTGGAFCEMEEKRYNVYYYDEHMRGTQKKDIEVHLDSEKFETTSEDCKMKRIIEKLNVAYEIAHSIYNSNVGGWNNVYFALEPIRNILNHNIMINNTIYDLRTKKHILRISRVSEELNYNYCMLYEKMISENKNDN